MLSLEISFSDITNLFAFPVLSAVISADKKQVARQ